MFKRILRSFFKKQQAESTPGRAIITNASYTVLDEENGGGFSGATARRIYRMLEQWRWAIAHWEWQKTSGGVTLHIQTKKPFIALTIHAWLGGTVEGVYLIIPVRHA